jgi:hypothetical protein
MKIIIAILVVLSALVTAIVIRRRHRQQDADVEVKLRNALERAEKFIAEHHPE